jgi:pre-mRNA cleavage complex 2 protein Pcf11
MFKLRQTWPPYFTSTVLHNLDTRTHYIDPAWPVTAQVPDSSPSGPNIHINPDFIQRV